MNTEFQEIDIHGCYSLVKIAFAPICMCKNNRWIWHHNASTLCTLMSQISCGDVAMLSQKDRPWWQWWDEWLIIVFSGFVCSGHRIACKKQNNVWVSMNNDFFCHVFISWRHSWKSLLNRLTHNKKKIFIQANPYIILYIFIMVIPLSS